MKKKELLLIIFICFISCRKNEELPPLTTEGSNTFAMQVNEKKWEPLVFPISLVSPPALDITYSTHTQLLKIEARNTKQNQSLIFYVEHIKDIGYYNFSYKKNTYDIRPNDSTLFLDNTGYQGAYKLLDSINSVMHILKLDTTKQIISGNFSLNLRNPLGSILSITEGRFDCKYIEE